MCFKTILTAALLGIVAFSCKKKNKEDDQPKPVETTVQQDKDNMKLSFDEMNSCAAEIKSGKMISLIKNVFQIDKGDAPEDKNQWMLTVIDSLESTFDFDAIEDDNQLNVVTLKGTYTFNNSTSKWDKTSASGNDIVFIFPSQKNGANDLKLLFTNYTDESHNIDGESIKLPKTFEMTFTQNSEVLAQMKLNSVQYEAAGTITIPTYIDASMVFSPLNMTIVARRVNPTLFDLNVNISSNGSCNSKFFAEAKLKSDDYENLDENGFEYLKGFASFNDMKVTSNIDLSTLVAIEEPTANQINSLLDLDVYMKDQKIGELEYYENSTKEGVYMVYKDGTKEDVEDTYLTPFLDDLEITLFDLLGNWSDGEEVASIN